jgi:hypothetical protein
MLSSTVLCLDSKKIEYMKYDFVGWARAIDRPTEGLKNYARACTEVPGKAIAPLPQVLWWFLDPQEG